MKKKRRSLLKKLLFVAVPVIIILLLFAFPFSPGRIDPVTVVDNLGVNYIVESDQTLTSVEKVREKHPKAIIYFTSTWCGSCKIIEEIIQKTSIDYKSISFIVLDIEAFRSLANEIHVNLPNALLYIDESTFSVDTNVQTERLKARINIFVDAGAFAL